MNIGLPRGELSQPDLGAVLGHHGSRQGDEPRLEDGLLALAREDVGHRGLERGKDHGSILRLLVKQANEPSFLVDRVLMA